MPSKRIIYLAVGSIALISIAIFISYQFSGSRNFLENIISPGGDSPDNVKVVQTGETTQKVTNDLLTAYLEAKAKGEKIDPDKLAEKILEENRESRETQLYTTSDLNVSEKSDRAAFKEYGNAMGNAFKKQSQYELVNADLVFKEALNTENAALLQKIGSVVAAYRSMESDMKNIKVPKTAASNHLKMMNAFKLAADDMADLQNFFEDPVQAIYAYDYLKSDIDALSRAMIENILLIEKSGATFSKSESGYLYTSLTN